MTNLPINLDHLKKANDISPIQNIQKLLPEAEYKCTWCKASVKTPIKSRYGTFCNDQDCEEMHYEHFIQPEVDERRQGWMDYENEREVY